MDQKAPGATPTALYPRQGGVRLAESDYHAPKGRIGCPTVCRRSPTMTKARIGWLLLGILCLADPLPWPKTRLGRRPTRQA